VNKYEDNGLKKLRLLFAWHMHQPYYKDDFTGLYTMPWVFLHAIKDYYELPWLMEEYSKQKAVFNLVPSLLVQLREYESENVNDIFLNTLKKPVISLDEKERLYLSENLFHSNVKTMVAPFPRYLDLANKKLAFKKIADFAATLTRVDFLDLEVLFLLSWCGNAVRQKSQIVQNLIAKGGGYDEDDKLELLSVLFSFVREIVPYYKQLAESGKIELFTTPFYHPILPLLIDKNSAKEACQNVVMPQKMAEFADDARTHVMDAVDMFKDTFGTAPLGFWPAEGSVSNDAISMLASCGVKWCAADEDVLFKTLGDSSKHSVYKKYLLDTANGKFGMVFRDKHLSDLVGFTYSGLNPNNAAKDFVQKLRAIYDDCGFEPVVSVVLDGENAWEFYENNAYGFFHALYKEIEDADWIESVTVKELFEQDLGVSLEIPYIKAGSWIYGTFSTWIGQGEKNRAWELLSTTKEFVNENIHKLNEKEKAIVKKELMIAEGSDWFWWYGDDHFTPLADQFDQLFRKHLINIYTTFESAPPQKITTPIISKAKSPYIKKPKGFIAPSMDGSVSSYYEWMDAGIVEFGFEFTAMDSSGFTIKKLRYGCDEKYLYLALFGNFEGMVDKDYAIGVHIVSHDKINIKVPLAKDLGGFTRHLANSEDVAFEAVVGDVVEMRIAKESLGLDGTNIIEIAFELFKNDQPIERAPMYSMLEIDVSDEFLDEWFI